MAYYTSLINAWNSATQPPNGVTGTGLLGGDTTAQKIAKINAWTITGSVPTSFLISGAQIANCVNYAEFKALTATQQANLLALFNQPGLLLGGSANVTHLAAGMIVDYFPAAGPTIVALTALAAAQVQTWWAANGYTSPIGLADLTAAGGLT